MNTCTYHQSCPVCGRSLSISVTLLGQRVYCQHCGGGFLARDPSTLGPSHNGRAEIQAAIVDDLLERADRLLAHAKSSEAELSSAGTGR